MRLTGFAVQLIDNNGQTVNGLITGYDTDTNLWYGSWGARQITSKENVKEGNPSHYLWFRRNDA